MKVCPHLAIWVWSKDYQLLSLLAPQSTQASVVPSLATSAQSMAPTPCLAASARLEHQPFQWTNLYMTRVHIPACTSPIMFFHSLVVVFFTNAFQSGPGNPIPVVIIPHSMTSSAFPRIPPPPVINPWILHSVFYQQSENGLTFSIPCASANVRSMTTFSRNPPCTPVPLYPNAVKARVTPKVFPVDSASLFHWPSAHSFHSLSLMSFHFSTTAPSHISSIFWSFHFIC